MRPSPSRRRPKLKFLTSRNYTRYPLYEARLLLSHAHPRLTMTAARLPVSVREHTPAMATCAGFRCPLSTPAVRCAGHCSSPGPRAHRRRRARTQAHVPPVLLERCVTIVTTLKPSWFLQMFDSAKVHADSGCRTNRLHRAGACTAPGACACLCVAPQPVLTPNQSARFLIFERRITECWSQLGAAVKTAQALSLHRDPARSVSLSPLFVPQLTNRAEDDTVPNGISSPDMELPIPRRPHVLVDPRATLLRSG